MTRTVPLPASVLPGEPRRRAGGPIAALTVTLLAILVAMVVATSTAPSTAQAQSSGQQPRVLGAFIGRDEVNDPTRGVNEPGGIEAFGEMVGAPPRAVMVYQAWGRDNDIKYFNYKLDNGVGIMDEIVSQGAMPIVTWTPRYPDQGATQPEFALRTIIAGDHDQYIRQWARDAAAWDKPFYLRFAHEMNGKWQPWSPGANGNTSAEFVAAWRHVHNIFAEEMKEKATNVRWVWSPFVTCGNCTAYSKVYPGNAYVDWVALDGYNWGTSQSWSSWQTMTKVFGRSYDRVTALAPTKPFMIAEVGSAEKGGDKAAWISNAFFKAIPSRMPKTKAIIWFSSNKETDWRVNSSDASLAAYKKAATDPSYRGLLP